MTLTLKYFQFPVPANQLLLQNKSAWHLYQTAELILLFYFHRTTEVKSADANHDDTVTLTSKDQKKMKKPTKRRTLLFIPSFRKSKKLAKYNKSAALDPSAPEAKVSDTDSGRDSDSVGSAPSDSLSIHSSSSSLDAISAEQRAGSLDSGIDCVASGSLSSSSMLPDFSRPVLIYRGERKSRGRAPIASPEDDSLLENIAEESPLLDDDDRATQATKSDADNSTSFRTIGDCSSSCSCDSCDSDSDSDSDNQGKTVRYNSSDSDSDLGRKEDNSGSVSSDSDSDCDLDQCSDLFSASQCSDLGASFRNSSLTSLNRSTSSHVSSGRSFRSVFSRIKTNGSVKHAQKTSNVLNRSAIPSTSAVSSRTAIPNSDNHIRLLNSSAPTVRSAQVSEFFMRTENDFRTHNSSRTMQPSTSSHSRSFSRNSLSRSSERLSSDHSRLSNSSLKRSYSARDRTGRQKLRSPTLQVRSTSLNREQNQDLRDLDSSVPNICADTNKSPAEIRQSLQKTAFWVENNAYDKKSDIGSGSLIDSKPAISERDLCNEIIGIYFGDDSDSSLSSSCLDSSLGPDSPPTPLCDDLSPVTSPPRTIETNIDDFSTAVYVPAPYPTSQATRRKISSGTCLVYDK